MNGFTILFRIGSDAADIRPADADPTLEQLQEAVDGYIERVPYFDTIDVSGVVCGCVAYCNEDGKNLNLPMNLGATRAWHHALQRILDKDGKRVYPHGLFSKDGGQAGNPVDLLVGSVIVVAGDAEFMRRHRGVFAS